MARLRKLAMAVAAATALSSGMAHALGLGEITLKSALNQPLEAEIALVEVKDLNQSEIIPNLGSAEDFSKAGVDRAYFLTGLKFTPVINANGKSVIRVTSPQPVREPYLNFLMEVLWPNGRLLREYTVLLDPPLYTPTPTITTSAPVASAPVVRSAPQPVVRAPQPAPAAAAPAPAARPAPVSAAPVASAGKLEGEYTSSKNDTLWEIALRARPAGASVHQTMLAIYDLNNGAFIDGNINRLKNGQVLRLPSAEQAKARTSDEAVALVAEHNKAWKEGRSVAASSARQLDATRRDTAGAAPATSAPSDRLSLVSGQEGKAKGSDKANAAGNDALQNKLAVTQESLDSSRRENTELKSRVTDLDSQLEKLQRLLKLKNEQLAKMQAELAKQGAAPVAPAVPADATAPVEAAKPADAPVQAVPADAAKADQPVDYNYTEEPAADKPAEPAVTPPVAEPVQPAPVTPVVEAPKPAPKPAKPVQEPVAPVAPVVTEEPSFVDDLLADPMMLGAAGGAGLLVLLLGLMAVSRRNAIKEAELQEANGLAGDDEGFDLDGDLDLGQDAELDADAMPEAADGKGDVLHEVDMLMAYGRFSQAAEQLNQAIDQEPERSDLRLKLMEVAGEMGDADNFARQENELNDIGGVQPQVDQLKAKYAALLGATAGAAALADDNFSLDDLSLDDVAEPTAEAADDGFDLSLDDLESELESDLAGAGDGLDDLSLDDDFSLDALNEPAAESAASSDDGFDLSLDDLAEPETAVADLDDAFDLSLDEEPKAAVTTEAADDLAALDDDFSFTLDDEPAEPAPAVADDAFDLSLDDAPAETSADDELAEFALSLEDEAPALADDGLSLDELSLDADSTDLGSDFDLSLDDDAPALSLDDAGDDFAAQLDEVSKDLDDLSDDLTALDDGAALDALDDLVESAPAAKQDAVVAEVATAAATADDDDFDFLAGTDETATKLDLARAYIDMGDNEGARDILSEVINEGNDSQQQEAKELMEKLS
ncbi:FimV/HubP family polar landmark protein [Atopomonas sediminilitoris]|uniref:FimV/HubP family polar landmark protein n=1 Tax=Atopomonas sediminilitoris TaxID=2919919 RepID=UPI001F4D5078|nr:FimV/HubP family polar landmark protein [Atopomonas sediminilitoris]MCJ8168795.1 peptigoglycan-binding protein LysM [Atopomonas sediminilitoris]